MTTVEEIREELRRGRTQAISESSQEFDGTSGDFEGFSRSDNREEQSISSDLHRPDSKNDATHGSYNDPERSLDEIIVGKRPANRRSSQGSSGTSNGTETVRGAKRRRGRIEADDPIPIREKSKNKGTGSRSASIKGEPSEKEESKPIQRGKKASEDREPVGEGESQKQKFKLPNLKIKEGTTLTIAEAKALEEPLLSALESDFHYLDQYIWYRTQDVTQAPIWSDLDNEDLTVLCSILLKRGQKSPATASVVRGIVNGSTYIDVAMLMGPRFVRTVQVLKDAPKIERPSLLDRKRMARGVQ